MASALLVALGSAVLLGAVMTAGDFVWAYFNIRHSVTAGVLHGAIMCLCIGGIIGARARRIAVGLLAGPAIGVLAAGAFYALAPTLRWGAMLPAWMLFWICFGILEGRLSSRPLTMAALRGVVAAVLSGLAFYAISGIWTKPSPGGPNYVVHFASWSFAFLPGFLALFAHRAGRHDPSR